MFLIGCADHWAAIREGRPKCLIAQIGGPEGQIFGVVPNQVTVPLVHLGLAGELSDKRSGAHNAYQVFFALWQDAEAGIHILQQAKSSYAKLQ